MLILSAGRTGTALRLPLPEISMLQNRALFLSILLGSTAVSVGAQAKLNDLEMAHVAVTADAIDIAYARIALERSHTPAIRTFAETMIRDHEAVTGQVVALAKKLNVQAQDNDFSRTLVTNSGPITANLNRLRGAAFDKFYARNELAYHQAVNGAVANQFIPNIQNADVKAAFEGALVIFRGHEHHAEMMVAGLKK
jgi:putative membrane protein